MAYKLKKPFTEKQKADFIVKYNHNLNLIIKDTKSFLYALEEGEIIQNDEVIMDPDFENKQKQEKRAFLDRLTLTKADFWIALLDRNITKTMVREKINLLEDEKMKTKTLIRLDDAEKYWRGDESLEILANMFGIDSSELDYLFLNKEFPEKSLKDKEIIDV